MREKSLFLEFVGESPTMKVMEYLILVEPFDFSITDMADNAGIGRATLYRIWDNLIKYEMIVPTRVVGKAKLYKANLKNPKIRKLKELARLILKEELKKRSEMYKHKMEIKS